MTCTACTDKLDDYVDATLAPADRAVVDAHLARCPSCRSALSSLTALRAATAALPRGLTPTRDLWPDLAAQLSSATATRGRERERVDFRDPRSPAAPLSNLLRFLLPLATAAAIALLLTLSAPRASRLTPHASPAAPAAGWSVSPLAGTPHLSAQPIAHTAPFRLGQWLETDASARAKVAVGAIGEVVVSPNSRLRLTGATAQHHRLELTRGSLEALITAPPRLFFVDTPSATAVDLGCAYTLTVDAEGHSVLQVSAGFVALEHEGRESIVPTRTKCLTRKGPGPGIPFHVDTAPALGAAVEAFDFGPASGRDAAFATIIAESRHHDQVTLWHLLSRTTGAQRALAFATLARLSPPPPAVTREAILAGDRAALRTWAEEMGLIFAR